MVTKFPSSANEILGARNVDAQNIQGFAIDLKAAGAANTDGGVETLPALPDSLRNPCNNCQFLIQKLSVDPRNFIVSGIEEYEPTVNNMVSSTFQGFKSPFLKR